MIGILGAGAFGTALAISLARQGTEVDLWTRDAVQAHEMRDQRTNSRRLPGETLPMAIRVRETLPDGADLLLLAIPMQQTAAFLEAHRALFAGRGVIGCAKGIDLASGLGSTGLIARSCPDAVPAVLTGPSFAADIAHGLPTALTLACADAAVGEAMQERLSTSALRLYRTTDVVGAELGGALKNVIAIGAGAVMGAGLGDSARAATLARMRFDAGATGLLDVLDAERTQLQAEDAFAASRTRTVTNAVALYRALSGGWPQTLPQQELLDGYVSGL